MGDAWAVGLAVAVSGGALAARPVPLWVGAAMALAALASRRPGLLCLGGLLLASGLGARAWAGTEALESRPVDQVVTLMSDPEPVAGGTRAVVEIDDRRVEAWARGSAGAALGRRLAGERVLVHGDLAPPPAAVARRLAVRHIIGRLQVDFVGDWSTGSPATRSANRLRRTLVDGAGSFTPAERALFTGFVIGDDRDQPPEILDDFRASGLAHLTAVSGQNVAFLLAVASPLLRRLRFGTRWAVTVGLVAWFALLTRFEPSVLRASAMAVLAVTAFAVGRPASGVRLVSLCVAGLLLIDPLLAHSVGWWMSVGATAGIVLGARPLADALPGPRWLAAAVSVSASAQLGVAPVTVAAFGSLPAASLPANLLAAPAAGPVMVWGLPAGVVAGLVPDPVAFVLHVPTRLCVQWLAFVARLAARLPLGQLRAAHLVALTLAAALVVVAPRRRGAGEPAARGALPLAAATLAAVAFVSAALAAPARAAPGQGLAVPGGRLWRDAGASVLVVESSDADLVAALRQAEVGQLDVLVVTSGHPRDQVTIDAVVRRHHPRLVLAPAGSRVEGARVASVGTAVTAGPLVVDVVAMDPLEVTVRQA